MSVHVKFFESLPLDEQTAVLEAARIGLQDNTILEEMDLGGVSAFQLVEKLDGYMNEGAQPK